MQHVGETDQQLNIKFATQRASMSGKCLEGQILANG